MQCCECEACSLHARYAGSSPSGGRIQRRIGSQQTAARVTLTAFGQLRALEMRGWLSHFASPQQARAGQRRRVLGRVSAEVCGARKLRRQRVDEVFVCEFLVTPPTTVSARASRVRHTSRLCEPLSESPSQRTRAEWVRVGKRMKPATAALRSRKC